MRRALGFGGRLVARLIKLVLLLVMLALLAVLVLGAVTTQRGWPQLTGAIELDGLRQPVTVIRDGAGILQITAANSHDLFMAQGYAHAQERMWQMEVSRRIGAGRLSELFGKSQVERDTFIRTLGWREAAKRDLDAMSPESRSILQAYADGVNAWIAQHDGKLSTPFVVAGLLSGTGGIGGYALEPWTPLDTATWQKVQAWSLGGNFDSEVFRLLADERLGDPARTDQLFPPSDPSGPVITPAGAMGGGAPATSSTPSGSLTIIDDAAVASEKAQASLSAGESAALGELGRLASTVSALAGFDPGGGLVGANGIGSNNWVVAGEHTETGKPMLANDPHLGFNMPSVWIINGLHCLNVDTTCPWDVVGVTFPGAPAVVLGHNAHIAWGATNVNPDTQDLFRITRDPADPDDRYLHDGQSLEFTVRHESIKVGGGSTVEIDIRSTVHGPVISDVDSRLEGGPMLALRWTSTAEADLALESFFEIDRATSFEEFKAAFDGYGSPSQNFIYADVDGHIGYVLPGLIPIRNKAAVDCPGDCLIRWATGERVRDGSTSDSDWLGYIPRDELPWQLDPPAGRIVSANNAPVDGTYPYWLGSEWDPGYRSMRINQLLDAAGDRVTLDTIRDIQMDTRILRADTILPRLFAYTPSPQTEDGRVLLQRLEEWDRECGIDSYGCAAYMSVEMALERAIFDDELGPLARDYVGTPVSWQALADVLRSDGNPWWDVAVEGVAPSHEPQALVSGILDSTAAALRAAFGAPESWTWGRLHEVTFRESTLGSSGLPPLELYFNAQSRPVAGAEGAVDNNFYQPWRAYPDPDDPMDKGVGLDQLFDVSGGPSYRFAIDMNDLDGARIVITTGQSGNPFDIHYIDQIPVWAAGDFLPLPFTASNVLASAAQTLTLLPGST